MLPFPAVVGDVHMLDKLTEAPDFVFLTFGVFLRHDPVDRFARRRFRHAFDEAQDTAFPPTLTPPHANPPATLFLDPSCLVPFAHLNFSLCAFHGIPYWRYRNL